jgi:glucose-6-phosphate isomerase
MQTQNKIIKSFPEVASVIGKAGRANTATDPAPTEMFETVININTPREELTIGEEPVDLDGLNYLAGKTVDFVNKSAMNGTILAHTDGQVPNFMVTVPEVNEFYLGELFYFFEFACGVSGYLLGVNPFNQPGVESYKKNMFALLGKPGYEAQREELLKRL